MNLSKAEAMKAVIDGIAIQHSVDDKTWNDSFASLNYPLITKLKGIDASCFPCVFRLKPTPKTISYRCFMYERLNKTVNVAVWCCEDEVSQTELEQSSEFVKWLGDTTEVEI